MPSATPQGPDARDQAQEHRLRQVESRHAVPSGLDRRRYLDVCDLGLPFRAREVRSLDHGPHLAIAASEGAMTARALLPPSEIHELHHAPAFGVAGRDIRHLRAPRQFVIVARVVIRLGPFLQRIGRWGPVACDEEK